MMTDTGKSTEQLPNLRMGAIILRKTGNPKSKKELGMHFEGKYIMWMHACVHLCVCMHIKFPCGKTSQINAKDEWGAWEFLQ